MILIDMEMPESCYVCDFREEIESHQEGTLVYCNFPGIGEWVHDYIVCRPKFCPLQKVLEATGDYISRNVAINALKAIRFGLWEIDIPSPTVPEYIEHHEQIKNMMEITDGWIKRLMEEPTLKEVKT